MQGTLAFVERRGGRRRGAGRKPKCARAGVRHQPREKLSGREPVLVTARLVAGLPSLRSGVVRKLLWRMFRRYRDKGGFRLVEFSIQGNHLHLIVEARHRRECTRTLQGMFGAIAKALNRLWWRRGRVFGDRFHDRVLAAPRQLRNALAYVLHNAKKHGHGLGRVPIDPYSSGPWSACWRQRLRVRGLEDVEPPVAAARTWMGTTGWRRHGLIDLAERPGRE